MFDGVEINCVSTHSRLKAAEQGNEQSVFSGAVSTHSRLKAADGSKKQENTSACFNTQPPEGGCENADLAAFEFASACFNTQPPEGGCWQM